ncbi:hypothetical protein BGW42_007433 [Actinomortierella wolfii]|nr:hypothetical protein BGW42_007433 [Actinomortierella wolfii]
MSIDVQHAESEAAQQVAKTKPHIKFDLSRASVVTSNFQLDKAISLKHPPDAACIISVPKEKEVSSIAPMKYMIKFLGSEFPGNFPFPVKMKPCAAYLHYIESKVLSGTSEHTLRKLKGYTSRFNVSAELKAGIKAGIFGCEASLEVTTGFSYGEDISQETEETWKTTVAPGKYVVYQTVVVYACRFDRDPKKICWDPNAKAKIREQNPSMKFYDGKGSHSDDLYFFMPLYRNSPFTIPYSDNLVDDIAFDTLTDYLMGDGFSKWEF